MWTDCIQIDRDPQYFGRVFHQPQSEQFCRLVEPVQMVTGKSKVVVIHLCSFTAAHFVTHR